MATGLGWATDGESVAQRHVGVLPHPGIGLDIELGAARPYL